MRKVECGIVNKELGVRIEEFGMRNNVGARYIAAHHPHSSLLIPNSSFQIPHPSFQTPHSKFLIPHS